ncbi:2-succinyl-6-hydroxy-2,4-cyclohexadiene-1-carboxylate synthase [Shewanella sp. C32]|uniref:Putative 2-succinyl-6-hydroxy-2,4-cyclohexadiene-1-carboxylate synthase n=1 Tax=Shewanella electrica TaxID=515560 RepID=A0ABT2FN72_9GAMM|nr:2-succinyl-6-hydroxy-2,4-cyclohexadiene-1-carboxylate synthase [Shewanella electrica]MCH1926252.1 2-succinyl-6-hydroxy-2,4-cyclohexadiene-1-carboxylate synthase [Shewanella electrica]MCS4557780.1 2-succinyl-6-hydroxy-2,4-cyclohexadiene-1-carboxylate synthase [Shewanella electrica]
MLHSQCVGDPRLPALVLLHGFLGSGADWQPLLATLSQQFYCITLDLPGHGQSQVTLPAAPDLADIAHGRTVANRDAVLQQCADLVQQTVQALGIQQYHLLGYSLGGRIALHVAARHAANLLSLQLESCHPGLTTEHERQQRAINDLHWQQQLQQQSMRQFLTAWYQQAVFAELSAAQREALIAQREQQNISALLAMYCGTSLALQAELWQLPQQLSCAVHYYYGSQDSKFAAIARAWQARAPLTLHPVADVGHNCHKGQPAAFLAQLLPTLNSIAENHA